MKFETHKIYIFEKPFEARKCRRIGYLFSLSSFYALNILLSARKGFWVVLVALDLEL